MAKTTKIILNKILEKAKQSKKYKKDDKEYKTIRLYDEDIKEIEEYLEEINFPTKVTKFEIRRLEKAVKDKNKYKLSEWATSLENQINEEFIDKFENKYREVLDEAICNWLLVITYTLHFNKCTGFGKKRLKSFMDDLNETVGMFKRKEAIPEDYVQELKEDGIIFKM